MVTVKDAIDMLNVVLHPQGFHCDKIELEYLPKEMVDDDTLAVVLRQSYDGRWFEPDKENYTLNLTADNMRYLWNAINVYNGLIYRLHLEPNIEKILMGMMNKEKMDGDDP